MPPSFFFLVKTVEIKSPFSLSHYLVTHFFNSLSISLKMTTLFFVEWAISGMFSLTGLFIKSVLSLHLTVSVISLSDVMELHWLK